MNLDQSELSIVLHQSQLTSACSADWPRSHTPSRSKCSTPAPIRGDLTTGVSSPPITAHLAAHAAALVGHAAALVHHVGDVDPALPAPAPAPGRWRPRAQGRGRVGGRELGLGGASTEQAGSLGTVSVMCYWLLLNICCGKIIHILLSPHKI